MKYEKNIHKYNLAQTTHQVFEECAAVYLKEDKHWGCDLDIILEYVEKIKDPEVIELGTGHAWHLVNMFLLSSSNLKRTVGVDYSEQMLQHAKSMISSTFQNGVALIHKIQLQKADILSLPFDDGSFNIALLLNNTLGNISANTFNESKQQRKKALGETRRILRQTGYLILSVFNSEKLTEEDTYGEVFELDRKLSDLNSADLVIRYKSTQTPYFSHWFSKNEICRLLYDASFKIVALEKRRKRIVVVAQKQRSDNSEYEDYSRNH